MLFMSNITICLPIFLCNILCVTINLSSIGPMTKTISQLSIRPTTSHVNKFFKSSKSLWKPNDLQSIKKLLLLFFQRQYHKQNNKI